MHFRGRLRLRKSTYTHLLCKRPSYLAAACGTAASTRRRSGARRTLLPGPAACWSHAIAPVPLLRPFQPTGTTFWLGLQPGAAAPYAQGRCPLLRGMQRCLRRRSLQKMVASRDLCAHLNIAFCQLGRFPPPLQPTRASTKGASTHRHPISCPRVQLVLRHRNGAFEYSTLKPHVSCLQSSVCVS